MADDRQYRVRQRAHEIWQREGRPEGAHERHWQQAESEIATEDGKSPTKSTAPRKPAAAKAVKPATAKPSAVAKTVAKPKAAAKSKAAVAKKV